MANILVNYSLFTSGQKIYVYDDDKNCVESLQVPINKISDVIGDLQNRYDIEQINLCGNQDYLSRFKAELGLKFANSNVEINIISK